MPDVHGGAAVNAVLADVHGVVADALDVTRDEDEIEIALCVRRVLLHAAGDAFDGGQIRVFAPGGKEKDKGGTGTRPADWAS